MKTSLFNTLEKKESFLRQSGNLVGFKKSQYYPFRCKLVRIQEYKETPVTVQLIGKERQDSEIYPSLNALIEAIDWEWMEEYYSCFNFFTQEQKLLFLQRPGNVVTFKEPQFAPLRCTQVCIHEYKEIPEGVQLIGFQERNSEKFPSIEALINAVDWEWMEEYVII